MNIQACKNRITICSSFYDSFRLLRFVFLDHNADIFIRGYESYRCTYYQIYRAEYAMLDGYSLYEIYSVHLGLLHYHTFMPEIIRMEIIDNKESKALFDLMHMILFFQYIKSLSLKFDSQYWYKLISHILSLEHARSIDTWSNINLHKSTKNLRLDHLKSSIVEILGIEKDKVTITKHHIFKFAKLELPTIGKFVLQLHTIGSHYYTSRCLFIDLALTSKSYNILLSSRTKLLSSLKLIAPELRIVVIANIQDAKFLSFILDRAELGLSTWIISNSNTALKLCNYIF